MTEVEKQTFVGDCRGGFMHMYRFEIERAFCKELSILCTEDRVVFDRAAWL